MKKIIYLSIILLLGACQNEVSIAPVTTPVLTSIPSPVKEGGEPNLFVSETGEIYLSWVEYANDSTDVLMFSTLKNKQWTTPKTIASGHNWFVNWADFPSLVAYKDGGQSLAAHWLQTSDEGTFDYDVRIAQSMDGGDTWSSSFVPHKDGISAEHGFVSMLPLSANEVFATWLDGRNTKAEGHGNEDEHGHHGAMTLRAATFDKNGQMSNEKELDNRVCDCCGTSVAQTDKGLIVAYRNRTEDEIRDIYTIRQENGQWRAPKPVFNDQWHISGCPVNGAKIQAAGQNVAIVWFSAPDDKPAVKVAFSTDSGETFGTPIRIDNGNPMGRVDLVLLSPKKVLASWMEKTKEGAVIQATTVSLDGKIGENIIISKTKAARQSGFPKMAKKDNQIIFAWTVTDSLSYIRTSMLKL